MLLMIKNHKLKKKIRSSRNDKHITESRSSMDTTADLMLNYRKRKKKSKGNRQKDGKQR